MDEINLETNDEKEYKRDKYIGIAILILVILIILGVALFSFYGYKMSKNNMEVEIATAYNNGVFDVVNAIGQTGNIPFLDNSTGTLQVREININEICANKK